MAYNQKRRGTDVTLDTTNFNGILGAADTNLQLAIDKLDDISPDSLYSANGTLAGARTVTMGGNDITFDGTQDTVIADSGDVTVGRNLSVAGDLTISGTTTTIDSTTVQVDDKNIELGTVATPTDATADGGGITLKGATDKTITWVDATDHWTFNQGIALNDGSGYTAAAGTVVATDSVNEAIEKLDGSLAGVGLDAGTAHLGTFTGTIISDNGTVKAGMQELETDLEALQGVMGVAAAAADLGTFTGDIISDNTDVKTGLQELETALEVLVGTVNTTSAARTMASTESVQLVQTTTAGAGVTITLPPVAGVATGQRFVVKDSEGSAATNNITVATSGGETIDTAATFVMDTSFESTTFVFDGTNFFAI